MEDPGIFEQSLTEKIESLKVLYSARGSSLVAIADGLQAQLRWLNPQSPGVEERCALISHLEFLFASKLHNDSFKRFGEITIQSLRERGDPKADKKIERLQSIYFIQEVPGAKLLLQLCSDQTEERTKENILFYCYRLLQLIGGVLTQTVSSKPHEELMLKSQCLLFLVCITGVASRKDSAFFTDAAERSVYAKAFRAALRNTENAWLDQVLYEVLMINAPLPNIGKDADPLSSVPRGIRRLSHLLVQKQYG